MTASGLIDFGWAVWLPAELLDALETLRIQRTRFPASLTVRGFNPLADYESVAAQEGYYALFRQRAEEWAAGVGREAYHAVTARAVGSLGVLVEYAAPLLREGGVLVAWKGRRDRAEEESGDRAAAAVGLTREAVVPVHPFPSSRTRHLYLYSKVSPTPDRFPRRPGVAAKRPLA